MSLHFFMLHLDAVVLTQPRCQRGRGKDSCFGARVLRGRVRLSGAACKGANVPVPRATRLVPRAKVLRAGGRVRLSGAACKGVLRGRVLTISCRAVPNQRG